MARKQAGARRRSPLKQGCPDARDRGMKRTRGRSLKLLPPVQLDGEQFRSVGEP
jgi:hypothetical protein